MTGWRGRMAWMDGGIDGLDVAGIDACGRMPVGGWMRASGGLGGWRNRWVGCETDECGLLKDTCGWLDAVIGWLGRTEEYMGWVWEDDCG